MSNITRQGLFLATLAFFFGCQNANNTLDTCSQNSFEDGKYILLQNLSLFDSESGQVLPDYAILIKDKNIYAIAPTSEICAPKNVQTIAYEGNLVTPGLIESHGHQVFNEPWDTIQMKFQKLLNGGITGIRNMAGHVPSYKKWNDSIQKGEVLGPNIYSSVFFAGQAFFNVDARLQKYRDFGADPGQEDWMRIINDQTNLEEAVQKAKASGATGIKLYASLQPEWVEEIIAEAKKNNMRVWTHAHLQFTETQEIVDAGPHSISHGPMLAHMIQSDGEIVKDYEAFDSIRLQKLFSTMAQNEIVFDVTLQLYFQYERLQSMSSFATKVVKAAHQQGVPIVAGSDSEGFWGDGSIALYDEIKALVNKAELSPEEALKTATYNAAKLLGIEATHGSIKVGKRADLVIFEQSPLENIANISAIKQVVKDGKMNSLTK